MINIFRMRTNHLLTRRIGEEQLLLDSQKCIIDNNNQFLEIKLTTNIRYDLRIEKEKRSKILWRSCKCKKGCDFCCYTRVDANIIEAFAAFEYFSYCNFLSNADRKSIQENISNYPKLFCQKSAPRYGFHSLAYSDNLSCPFLLNNVCSIYLARPATCRSDHTYGSQEECKTFGGRGYLNPSIVKTAKALFDSGIHFQQSYSQESSFVNESISVKLDEKPFVGVFGILLNIVWGMKTLSIRDAKRQYLKLINKHGIDDGELPGQNISKQEQVLETIAKVYGTSRASRNEPCPCGSGKKYKRCCGKSF